MSSASSRRSSRSHSTPQNKSAVIGEKFRSRFLDEIHVVLRQRVVGLLRTEESTDETFVNPRENKKIWTPPTRTNFSRNTLLDLSLVVRNGVEV
jgi:hypothetical protein